jgi:hypothetical protein
MLTGAVVAATSPTTRARDEAFVEVTGAAWSGRLAPDVEDGRTLLGQEDPVCHRRAGLEEAAAVGERVGGDVDDAHDCASVTADSRPCEHESAGYRSAPVPAVGVTEVLGA